MKRFPHDDNQLEVSGMEFNAYKCCWDQKEGIDNIFPRLQQGLWIFVETFQGYYRDGSIGQQDFRAISGTHFIILLLISSACISDRIRFSRLPYVQPLLILVSLFYVTACPCNEPTANIIQSLLLVLTAFILQLAYLITVHIKTYFAQLMFLLCLLAPMQFCIAMLCTKL